MNVQTNNSVEIKKHREPGIARRLLKSLGHKGLEKQASLITEPTPLPEGYRYKNSKLLKPKEVGRLFQQVKAGEHVSDRHWGDRKAWAKANGKSLEDVAVVDDKGTLVGFGSIHYSGNEGTMRDFVVSPGHQGKGVGKAILLERLRVAEQMGITTLHVPKPEDTNSLHNPSSGGNSFYLEHGFQQLEDGSLIRHSNALPQGHAEIAGTGIGA